MPSASSATAVLNNTVRYGRFLVFVAGLGGLLYGIDVGIIAAALLYLNRTVNLTVEQTSIIVAAVLGGGMFSSLVGGVFADWLGRKKMMIISGLLFVVSVGLIVVSQGFVPLFLGRLLQGFSGGVIAVVVPLYLAECLGADFRGRGTAVFQFMLTFGIVIAAVVGWYYTREAESAIAVAAGNQQLVLAAANHAWRGMFLAIVYPGLIFFLGSFFLSESPRWLFRQGREDQALAALRRSSVEDAAQRQLREMRRLAQETGTQRAAKTTGSLFQRKYVVPFVLACVILTCNQSTGINSILQFLVVILKQAGMNGAHATAGDVAVKVLNCVMTVVAVALVDRKGRRFLLKLGTAGIILALLAGALVFHRFESRRVDIKDMLQSEVKAGSIELPLAQLQGQETALRGVENGSPVGLTVLYSYGQGDRLASVLSADPDPVLRIGKDIGKGTEPEAGTAPLQIKRALYGPVPSETTGWLVTACLCLFIASFALGPGVVVWLTLSELMPTRIRSVGMGVALLLNQGASTLIAGVFLPVVGRYGYYAMFTFWALCTVVYFITAAFFLPETKGRTLEEIEQHFEGENVAMGNARG
jgi:MFS transporter, SP family, solute carrier family 2 (myo-inositol transporter), member 13